MGVGGGGGAGVVVVVVVAAIVADVVVGHARTCVRFAIFMGWAPTGHWRHHLWCMAFRRSRGGGLVRTTGLAQLNLNRWDGVARLGHVCMHEHDDRLAVWRMSAE